MRERWVEYHQLSLPLWWWDSRSQTLSEQSCSGTRPQLIHISVSKSSIVLITTQGRRLEYTIFAYLKSLLYLCVILWVFSQNSLGMKCQSKSFDGLSFLWPLSSKYNSEQMSEAQESLHMNIYGLSPQFSCRRGTVRCYSCCCFLQPFPINWRICCLVSLKKIKTLNSLAFL